MLGLEQCLQSMKEEIIVDKIWQMIDVVDSDNVVEPVTDHFDGV